MKPSQELEKRLVDEIAHRFPALPKGTSNTKWAKTRIRYNIGNRRRNEDYGFQIDLSTLPIELIDFRPKYWIPKLDVNTKEEFTKIVEEIYYSIVHPVSEELPIKTRSEMRIHRRFDGIVVDQDTDDEDKIIVDLISLGLQVEFAKDNFEFIKPTGRTKDGKEIQRFVMKYESMDEILDKVEKQEDIADQSFMEELMRKTYGKKD